MFCIKFQAFVQLLWSNRNYTFTLNSEIPSRQNMWPMLSIIFFIMMSTACNYSMSHGGVNSGVWKMHCNEFAKQLFPKFFSHPSSNAWSEAIHIKTFRHCVHKEASAKARLQCFFKFLQHPVTKARTMPSNQNALNSALWLAHMVNAVATGSWKNLDTAVQSGGIITCIVGLELRH